MHKVFPKIIHSQFIKILNDSEQAGFHSGVTMHDNLQVVNQVVGKALE